MKRKSNLPGNLERLRGRFEAWRRTKKGHPAIPDGLWQAAIRLTGRYSVNRVARALRLNGSDLKKRALTASRRRVAKKVPGPTFVEVGFPLASTSPTCVVEMENCRGAKLRVSIRDQDRLDLVALGEAFWRQDT